MDAYEFNLKHQARVPGVASISHVIREIVNNGDGNPEYIGYAKRGSLTSQAAWTVEKVSYNGDQTILRSRISPDNQIMDNYAALTYA